MEILYTNQLKCDINLCKEKLEENYRKLWVKEIKKKPKLRTYSDIKNSFNTEYYIKLNIDRSLRSFLAQLRSGTYHFI